MTAKKVTAAKEREEREREIERERERERKRERGGASCGVFKSTRQGLFSLVCTQSTAL